MDFKDVLGLVNKYGFTMEEALARYGKENKRAREERQEALEDACKAEHVRLGVLHVKKKPWNTDVSWSISPMK